ncbi:hypothetical protein C8R47DRAFT_1075648 [Mycena vitilis]|nr:hypothetical protein C8R47DRAFT_1075648 [Mycena vitilis]
MSREWKKERRREDSWRCGSSAEHDPYTANLLVVLYQLSTSSVAKGVHRSFSGSPPSFYFLDATPQSDERRSVNKAQQRSSTRANHGAFMRCREPVRFGFAPCVWKDWIAYLPTRRCNRSRNDKIRSEDGKGNQGECRAVGAEGRRRGAVRGREKRFCEQYTTAQDTVDKDEDDEIEIEKAAGVGHGKWEQGGKGKGCLC